MGVFHIRNGKDIKLKGAAAKEIIEQPLPSRVSVNPPDFKGLKLRPQVKIDDIVKRGTVLLTDKTNENIRIVSPAAGKVAAINRGEKRALLEVVVETDAPQATIEFEKYSEEQIKGLSREKIIELLLNGGLWPALRQRPFSKIADPSGKPKSIFVQALNTDPLSLDNDFILEDHYEDFQSGLNILKKLTDGAVNLCSSAAAKSKALSQAQGADIHKFSGPHPTGNVSTSIHYIDPIKKGDVVWYLGAQDVLRIALLIKEGKYPTLRYVALTGEGVSKAIYVKTTVGASIESLLDEPSKEGMRYITGSVLSGNAVNYNGFLGFYDSQVTVIPESPGRELLGWIKPGINKFTFSQTFVSAFLPKKEVSLSTDKQGSDRAIVLNHIYDDLVSLDIMVYFLLRAVIAGEIEEAEELGILECDEEDFALCTFACPSKTDVGAIIGDGLDLIDKEG